MQDYEGFEQENISYWSKRAPGYSAVNRSELSSGQRSVWKRTLASHMDEALQGNDKRAVRIVDAGTGPGFFAVLLAEMGYAVTAADYTDAMLDEARRNAGIWADHIDFHKGNVEHLALPDEFADIIVTRNVTWNLRFPERAYREWRRILKRGGMLLNFDANWYRYLYDPEARKGYLEDRDAIRRYGVADETEGTDVPAMEAIAYQTPLAAVRRPAWDVSVLRRLGMEVWTDEDIWKTVWTKEEFINNRSTPMFMIKAVKPL